jgi:VanZ family protein
MRTVLPSALFLLLLGVWTWKLLEPSPVPERVAEEIPTDAKFILAKIAHAAAYAVLTVLAAWLPVRKPYFWLVVALLAAHGIATEAAQRFLVPNRHGSVRDVLIDWAGIGLGLLALEWLGWGRSSRQA